MYPIGMFLYMSTLLASVFWVAYPCFRSCLSNTIVCVSIRCTFDGKTCFAQDFTSVHTDFGVCYSFNNDENNILKVNRVGKCSPFLYAFLSKSPETCWHCCSVKTITSTQMQTYSVVISASICLKVLSNPSYILWYMKTDELKINLSLTYKPKQISQCVGIPSTILLIVGCFE